MYSNQFIEMKRMEFVTANGSVCVSVCNKLKPLNIEAAHVASALRSLSLLAGLPARQWVA